MKKVKKVIISGYVCLLTVMLLCVGCGSKESKGIEVNKEQITEETKTTEDTANVQEIKDGQLSQAAVEINQHTVSSNTKDNVESSAEIVVYVCGAVNHPGVYTLSGTPRMMDAVEAAGGMNEQADKNVLNLAQYISDGQMIRIPAIGEVTDTGDWLEQQSGYRDDNDNDTTDSIGAQQEDSSKKQTDDKVDLNTADAAELMTIPGIGQTKAEAIIRYREENGSFQKVEDIMQISGIKEGSFAKMEPYICVK